MKDIAVHIEKELDIGTREMKVERRNKGGESRNYTETINSLATEYKSGVYATQSDLHTMRLEAIIMKESPDKYGRD